jgi:hypothetical protein
MTSRRNFFQAAGLAGGAIAAAAAQIRFLFCELI